MSDQRTFYYDPLGRLKTTTSGSGANAVTTTDTFNIQGWLTSRTAKKGTGGSATNALSEKGISYDRAGNITALTRYDNSSSPVATSLSYAYTGNRRNGYSYDVNGNVTSDATNNLRSSYNLINLPAQDIGSIYVRKAFKKYEKDNTPAPIHGPASVLRENVFSQQRCLSQRRVDRPDGRSYLRLGG